MAYKHKVCMLECVYPNKNRAKSNILKYCLYIVIIFLIKFLLDCFLRSGQRKEKNANEYLK